MTRSRARTARVGLALALLLVVTGCSAETKVTSTMDDTVRQVRGRVAVVANESGSLAELRRRVRAGEAYTLLVLDAGPEDIRTTKPFPTTAITALHSTDGRLELELFTTGHESRQTGWFGDEATNLFGCALVTAEPGGGASARGTTCGRTVLEVFPEPWDQVRLHP